MRVRIACGVLGALIIAAAGGGPAQAATVCVRGTDAASGLRGSLCAPTRTPVAKARWPYVVTAMDRTGHRVRALVHLQVLFSGVPVGQVGRHRVTGVWRETIRWPADSVGHALVFEAQVTALGHTITLDLPFSVRPR